MFARCSPTPRRNRFGRPFPTAFTLVELIVVIAIIALLIAILLPSLSALRRRAASATELAAARQLITAWTTYATDHKGRVIPGYVATPGVEDEAGNELVFPTNARYPWRLAPYLDYNFRGLYLDPQTADAVQSLDSELSTYVVSLYPSLGLNSAFVGGHQGQYGGFNNTFEQTFGRFYMRSLSEPRDPTKQLVFCSARAVNDPDFNFAGEVIEGNFFVKPPYFVNRLWSDAWDPDAPPDDFGFVSLRHNRRAVTAFVDGHVESLDELELQDMRYWAPRATRGDWTLTPQ